MKANKALTLSLIIINIIGTACLIYFSVPFYKHDITIVHPDAMLPAEAWDVAGMTLTFGLIPLLIANVLIYLSIEIRRKKIKLLFFFPSILCFITVVNYWITAIN